MTLGFSLDTVDPPSYSTIFEGFNAHLWAPNSGRLLWMTQPAWPSNYWQILSSDYDTQASYYGVMKAAEPVHVQLNLPGFDIAVINNTQKPLSGLRLRVRVLSTHNDTLVDREETVTAPAAGLTPVTDPALDIAKQVASGLVFVKLELRNTAGVLLSDNFYWEGKDPASYKVLNDIGAVALQGKATLQQDPSGEHTVHLVLHNTGATIALETKLTLQNATDGTRILPAYYTDNYISLLPDESRDIEITYPAEVAGEVQVALRGWNLTPAIIAIAR